MSPRLPLYSPLRLAGILLLAGVSVSNVKARTPADNHYFIAAAIGAHNRDGYLDFGNDRVEYVPRNRLWSIGLSAGKNFGLPLGIRLALPMQFDYGKVVEDTVSDLTLVDGTSPPLALYSLMYHLGLEPILQFPFRCAPRIWMYGALGGGVHYVTITEELRLINDAQNRRVEGDFRLEEGSKVSFSAAAGGGIEITMAPHASLFLNYTFRFWQPVHRKTHRDLFPLDAQPYRERFLSNMLSLGILFSREH